PDEVREARRPEPLRERCDLARSAVGGFGEEVAHDPSMLRAMAATDLRDEVTDLLQRLIRVDTTNPPGNETAAAELLRDYLAENGVESQLIAKIPERANLIARIPGAGGPSLLLLCHTDVVYADPADWKV